MTSVSVVVASFNERAHISECLDSLGNQRHPAEIIVVDDGSSDGTPDLVAARGDARLVRVPHRGAATAKNAGARVASGDILVFADADMIFPPDFIDNLIAPMLQRGATGTFTKEILVANPDKRWARAHMLGRGLPPLSHFRPDFSDQWENFRAVWRSDFLRVGGYDEVGHGEDMTLAPKLGALAEAAPGAVCWHYEPERLADILSSARWVGRGSRILELRTSPLRHYGPFRSLPRAVRLAVFHRLPSLAVYRLLWDAGVLYGWLTRRAVSSAAK